MDPTGGGVVLGISQVRKGVGPVQQRRAQAKPNGSQAYCSGHVLGKSPSTTDWEKPRRDPRQTGHVYRRSPAFVSRWPENSPIVLLLTFIFIYLFQIFIYSFLSYLFVYVIYLFIY